jgi:hypothetical protein
MSENIDVWEITTSIFIDVGDSKRQKNISDVALIATSLIIDVAYIQLL